MIATPRCQSWRQRGTLRRASTPFSGLLPALLREGEGVVRNPPVDLFIDVACPGTNAPAGECGAVWTNSAPQILISGFAGWVGRSRANAALVGLCLPVDSPCRTSTSRRGQCLLSCTGGRGRTNARR